MSITDVAVKIARPLPRVPTAWDRLKTNRNWLAFWFMLPAAAFLIVLSENHIRA
jgi:multiple sugar transport system permease protein